MSTLLRLPNAKKISDTQIAIRCPICGDSQKHTDSAHCYIGQINGTGPLVYHCWINDCSGIVNADFLKLCKIYNTKFITEVQLFNNSHKNSDGIKKIYTNNDIGKFIKSSVNTSNSVFETKYGYLVYRLGVKLTLEELERCKIIFSLFDFLKENNLNITKKYEKVVNTLENQYIGFLSSNKTYIVFRNLFNDKNLRYFNYPIFGQLENSNKFYTINTSANILSDDVTLHIAEGCFDILSIYSNIMRYNTVDNIYTAVCGSGYLSVLRYFILLGFISNLNVRIYSDKDKKISYYKDLITELTPWVKSINVYYNSKKGEKDFGVPLDRIVINKYSKL